MYKKACKEALNFIRPMIIGKKYYGVNDILNDIGTIMVVNQNGDMITTKEIAENIILSIDTKDVFTPIFAEMQNKNYKQIKKIEKKYDLNDKTITNICIQIIDVAESITNIEIVFHKYLNLALIKNTNNNLLISKFPKFENSKLTATKSENIDAPIINEFPICMECEFIEYGDCGVIGKVINTSVDVNAMNGDKVDIEKVSAIAFDPYTHGYYTVTKRVGNAFKDGMQLK